MGSLQLMNMTMSKLRQNRASAAYVLLLHDSWLVIDNRLDDGVCMAT